MLKYFKGRSFGYVFRFCLAAPLAILIWLCIEIINIFKPVYIVGLSNKGRINHYMRYMELHLRNANQLHKKYNDNQHNFIIHRPHKHDNTAAAD